MYIKLINNYTDYSHKYMVSEKQKQKIFAMSNNQNNDKAVEYMLVILVNKKMYKSNFHCQE